MGKIIIVSGASATGKTTLAQFLAEKLKLPYFGKDQIKEQLFDSLGWSDKAWSKKLGAAAIKLLYLSAKSIMSAGGNLILEANFKPEMDKIQIEDLVRRYNYEILEFHCSAPFEVLAARFKSRMENNQRHPGHVDEIVLAKYFDPQLHSQLTTAAVEVDSSDFSKMNYSELLNTAKQFINE